MCSPGWNLHRSGPFRDQDGEVGMALVTPAPATPPGGRTSADAVSLLSRESLLQRWPAFARKLIAFAGPGYLVAVGYMDPGNWATDNRRRVQVRLRPDAPSC